jgi:hypothetical protein
LQPQTCATFTLLHHFHLQILQSKMSTHHFYEALERETDNTDLVPIKVCLNLSFTTYFADILSPQSWYKELLRMIREWRHLKLLKRAGRSHDPQGVAGTQKGELAVPCPACPHPSVNLPDGWENAASDQQ